MDQRLVRLRENAVAEVRYADGVHRIYRERLRQDEKDLAVARLSGTVRAIAWLIEDRTAMIGALRRVGRRLRDARERLRALDNARGPHGPRLASMPMSPLTDAPPLMPGACRGTERDHRV